MLKVAERIKKHESSFGKGEYDDHLKEKIQVVLKSKLLYSRSWS